MTRKLLSAVLVLWFLVTTASVSASADTGVEGESITAFEWKFDAYVCSVENPQPRVYIVSLRCGAKIFHVVCSDTIKREPNRIPIRDLLVPVCGILQRGDYATFEGDWKNGLPRLKRINAGTGSCFPDDRENICSPPPPPEDTKK